MRSDIQNEQALYRSLVPTVIGYGLMVLATIAAFLLIRSYGETLLAPTAVARPTSPRPCKADTLLRVLAALTAIIVTGQMLGWVFARLNQPPVIGEVVAGILLGPSLLGPEVSALILPPSVAPYLGIIAQLGVILYMFLVGVELNPALLKQRAHATVAMSHAKHPGGSFILGALLAPLLYPRVSSRLSFVYQLCSVHGRVDVDHGLSGACAHPHRLPDEPDQAWSAGSELCGHR